MHLNVIYCDTYDNKEIISSVYIYIHIHVCIVYAVCRATVPLPRLSLDSVAYHGPWKVSASLPPERATRNRASLYYATAA